MNSTKTHITGVRTVSVPVANQDTALDFYVGTLGFTKLRDAPTPNGGRWIELAPRRRKHHHHPRTRGTGHLPRRDRHPLLHR